MAFTIQVFSDEHETVSGARVKFAFTSILRGMSSTEYTDEDGIATFDTKYDDGSIEVFVNGSSQGDFFYSWGDSITVTLD